MFDKRLFSGFTRLRILVVCGKGTGPPRKTISNEDVERVKKAVLKFPKRASPKHAPTLTISDLIVEQILHENIKFDPYKLAVVNHLNPRDRVARKRACVDYIEQLTQGALVFISN